MQERSNSKLPLTKGREEGIEKGIEKGREKNAMDAAVKMLTDGLPVDTISKYTGLTQAECDTP